MLLLGWAAIALVAEAFLMAWRYVSGRKVDWVLEALFTVGWPLCLVACWASGLAAVFYTVWWVIMVVTGGPHLPADQSPFETRTARLAR
jgi:hypothetical protein